MAILHVVHISDIHLGAGFVPRAQGHDPLILEGFFTFAQQDPGGYKPDALLVTGDVTARGSTSDLQMYLTYRDVGYAPDAVFRPFAAPRHTFPQVIDLPGNHDYWRGVILNPVLSDAIRTRYFPRDTTITLRGSRHLVAIHALCSTRGAHPFEQAGAVGAFHRDDLVVLAGRMDAVNGSARRDDLAPFHLIATHHSPSYGTHRAHGLALRAFSDLAPLVASGPVRGLLTGHVHTRAMVPARNPPPAEVRCAATMQRTILGPGAGELLVHEFADDDSGPLTWTVTTWRWSGTAFARDPAGSQPVEY
jgi:3',5'-cyclic AMP phosphodiesterase CpdA